MAVLKIHWNLVEAASDFQASSVFQSQIVSRSLIRQVPEGCRGVYFRSVLSEELDFNQFLSELSLEEFRRSRNEPDQTFLFRPKKKEQKSIGTLRIVRPLRFVPKDIPLPEVKGLFGALGAGALSFFGNNQVFPVERKRGEFEVLLESTEFLLEEAQEQMAERFQLQETFSDFNVFFFGRRAEIFSYSGSLLNADKNLQWRNQFLDDYEKFLRGTRCAELGARAYLLYDDVVREGFILSAGINQQSVVEGVVKFNFTMLITNKRILGEVPNIRASKLVKVDTKFSGGINDIQFIKSIDPNLPGVTLERSFIDGSTGFGPAVIPPEADPTGALALAQSLAAEATKTFVARFPFVVDPRLTEELPPGDLEKVMIDRTIAALSKVSSELTRSSHTDHDILVDFVPESELPLRTKRAIAGDKILDVANLKGEIIAELLISGSKTISSLRLGEAIAAANHLSTQGERIGQDLAKKLKALATLLARGKSRELKEKTSETNYVKDFFVLPGFEDLVQKFLATGTPSVPPSTTRYVLKAELDSELLTNLKASTLPILEFNRATTSDEVVSLLPVSITDAFVRDRDFLSTFATARIYIASFLVVKLGLDVFSSITDNFKNTTPISKENAVALTFVDNQSIKDFGNTGIALPLQVEDGLEEALKNLKNAFVFKAINDDTGISKEDIPITETILKEQVAFSNAIPELIVKADEVEFIHGVGTFVTAISAERLNETDRSSTDSLGRTVQTSDALTSAVFAETYFRRDLPRKLELFGAAITKFRVAFHKGAIGAKDIISNPGKAPVLVFPTGIQDGRVAYGVEQIGGGERITFPPGSAEELMLRFGIMTIPADKLDFVKSLDEPIVTFSTKGVPPGAPFGVIDLIVDNGEILGETPSKGIFGLVVPKERTFNYSAFPARRVYGTSSGKNLTTYEPATSGTLQKITQEIGNRVVDASNKVAPLVAKGLNDILSRPDSLIGAGLSEVPVSGEDRDRIRKVMELKNFSTIFTINDVREALVGVGIFVKDYIDLSTMVGVELPAIKAIDQLGDALQGAVDAADKDKDGNLITVPRDIVRDDKNRRDNLCRSRRAIPPVIAAGQATAGGVVGTTP